MFPPELINHIFSYMEGSTNQIMKSHLQLMSSYHLNVFTILQLLNTYKLTHFFTFRTISFSFLVRTHIKHIYTYQTAISETFVPASCTYTNITFQRMHAA